jgi:hypothetical protein
LRSRASCADTRLRSRRRILGAGAQRETASGATPRTAAQPNGRQPHAPLALPLSLGVGLAARSGPLAKLARRVLLLLLLVGPAAARASLAVACGGRRQRKCARHAGLLPTLRRLPRRGALPSSLRVGQATTLGRHKSLRRSHSFTGVVHLAPRVTSAASVRAKLDSYGRKKAAVASARVGDGAKIASPARNRARRYAHVRSSHASTRACRRLRGVALII